MRIIPSNKYLLKCKIGETALCEFCTMEIETINHLFWKCNYVQHFWANLATFLLRYNITVNFSLKYVTFGITKKANCIETQVKNFTILLGKYVIFKNKCLETQPTMSHFKVYPILIFMLIGGLDCVILDCIDSWSLHSYLLWFSLGPNKSCVRDLAVLFYSEQVTKYVFLSCSWYWPHL